MNDEKRSIDVAFSGETTLFNDIVANDQGFTEQAKRQFSYYQDILHGYNLHRESALKNNRLTPAGRYLVLIELKEMFETCQKVLNYAATVTDQIFSAQKAIDRPLIMCGLPRTGSTLLFNLLACDPNCRAPLATDMFVDCVPPVSRQNAIEHQRRTTVIKAFRQRREALTNMISKQAASHPVFPVEEDFLIFRHIGISILSHIKTLDQVFDLEKWLYDETNKNFAYEYHRLFLRMLNSVDKPQSHWLIKGIMHSLYMDTLLDYYPQALLLMTHRNLHDIIPSFCRFIWEAYQFCFPQNDPISEKLVIKIAREMIDTMIKRLVQFRSNSRHTHLQSYKNICDIDYNDLILEPIATVRRIYEHFGLLYSEEFERAMESWLEENPQGKQGRNPYNLADINLTSADIDRNYNDYIDLFFVKME